MREPVFSLLNVGWAKDDERWNFGPICSTFMRMYWVTRGEATVTMGNRDYTLRAGHFYLIPPLRTHYDRSKGLFEHFYLHVADSSHMLAHILEHYNLPFEVAADERCSQFFVQLTEQYPSFTLPRPNPESYENVMGLMASEHRYAALPLSQRMEVEGMLMMILARFVSLARKQMQVTDNRISNSIRYIEDNLQLSLSIDMLATNAALSKEQFIRLFHRQTGTSPMAYIISRRIFRAQMLLSQGGLSVKEVSTQLGFGYPSYFCRIFRKHVGMSPKQFVMQNK